MIYYSYREVVAFLESCLRRIYRIYIYIYRRILPKWKIIIKAKRCQNNWFEKDTKMDTKKEMENKCQWITRIKRDCRWTIWKSSSFVRRFKNTNVDLQIMLSRRVFEIHFKLLTPHFIRPTHSSQSFTKLNLNWEVNTMKFSLSHLGVALITFRRLDVSWLSYITAGTLLSEHIRHSLEVGAPENLSMPTEKILNKEKENKKNKTSKKFE